MSETPVSKTVRGLQEGGTAELWPVSPELFREEDDERADHGGEEEEIEEEQEKEVWEEERWGKEEREEMEEEIEEMEERSRGKEEREGERKKEEEDEERMFDDHDFESEEDIPEDWAKAIEEVERDIDPDYTVEEEEEEGNGEEDEQLMNVAKRQRKPQSETITRERKECHLCGILVVKLPRHLRKMHAFSRDNSLPNSQGKKKKICPEPGCGRSVVRMDTHFVKCHGMERGRELHEKVIETKKSVTASSLRKGEQENKKSSWMNMNR
ncbi:cilia- and flagella-associated protein 251-like [Ostrea edulis]|uniref:cilia- and flagella-associated protein 251-like n=1 Tax=Ostrea edulis TaxID=37623 RepID=UPI0024AF3F50|nr:cilia- and flagella-associated protein 251-like [Ostrea edulis]